ncbi:hypothetical protein [Frankia sp. AgB32]|uniref:hypothetical protein n=1 Tax=Frankia sp. AgB32 TaxID=631119 RepID=UPI00201042E1|nr:hypothetical protein [Frankia sp. AgB32]MCK9894710.1 hypothetical protein [Frankia sp. AgB32]
MIGPDSLPFLLTGLPAEELPPVPPPFGRRPRWWGLAAWTLLLGVALFLAAPVGFALGVGWAAR